MQKVMLNNKFTIPILGLGTWKSKSGEVKNAVEAAIDCGYRHIDCAFAYGNEKEVGEALKKKFDEKVVTREDMFITSKLWNTKHAAAYVKPALKHTLEDLQLNYLDLYLIHWPIGWKAGDEMFPKDSDGNLIYSDVHYNETWAALEECVNDGLTKSIGLSNFNSKQVDDICKIAEIKPVMNQVEIHPYLIQNELIAHCKKKGICMTAYSPLGSHDRPWAALNEPCLLQDEELIKIGKKYDKSPAQVCIRWQIQRGIVVIPKSVTPSRIKENSEVFDFVLSEEDVTKIESFHRNWRACLPTIVRDGVKVERDAHHAHYPFGIPF